jgi:hypothetical protein
VEFHQYKTIKIMTQALELIGTGLVATGIITAGFYIGKIHDALRIFGERPYSTKNRSIF